MAESTDNHKLIVSLEARIRSYEKNLERAQSQTNQRMKGIETALKRPQAEFDRLGAQSGRVLRKMETDTARSSQVIGANFKAIGASFAAGLSIQGAQKLIDSATRIRNALKVAGLEGGNLTKVYNQLFQSAQKNAAPLETLVTLYSRVSQAQDALGVSQGQILNFTDKIALALRVAGTDAQTASGALLQLSQALGSGTVRAEEFNSVNEGARPILQAVAAGLKEAGGSVSKLRSLVLDGKVSSAAFFRAFEAGAGTLEAKVAGAELTVSQALIRLQNVLIDVAGKMDLATGASGKLAGFLSNDLTNALKEIGGIFEGASTGPIAGFVDMVNKATDAVLGLSAKLGHITGLDNVGKALGAQPYRSDAFKPRTAPEIRALIADLEKDKAQTGSPGIIQGQIDELYDELADLEGRGSGPSTRGGRRGVSGAAGTSGASSPGKVSLADYPVDPSTGSGSGRSKVADSFDKLDDAVDRFVANVVKAESGGNPNAKNLNSTATGLGQFIESTWLRLFKQNFPDRAQSMSDATILALRKDADVSIALIKAYAKENAGLLRQAGIAVNEANLQLAHFLGPGGAISVLKAAPGTPVSSVLSQQAISANPSILGGGATVDDVIRYATRRAAANAELSGSLEGIASHTKSVKSANDDLEDSYQSLGEIGIGALRGIAGALADGKIDAREWLNIIADVVEQLLRLPTDKINLGGGGGGGLFGGIKSILSLFFHEGGKVGAGGAPRMIPASVFAGAPRFHSGLKSDEFAAVLQRGERVLTARDDKRSTDLITGLSNRVAKGGDGKRMSVENHFHIDGAITKKDVVDMVQGGMHQAIDTAKRSFPDWQIEYHKAGAFS